MCPVTPETLRTCGLAIAVPLTRDRFLADYGNESKEFVRLWARGCPGFSIERLWRHYSGIATYGLQVAAETEAAGARVAIDATLASIAALARGCSALTIVAHWAETRDAAIELTDGITPVDAVADGLPPDFSGVIDLTVCTSTRAIAAFKRLRPRCTVIANREPASLDVRLAMYRQLVHLLRREPMSYVDAAQHLRLAALEAL